MNDALVTAPTQPQPVSDGLIRIEALEAELLKLEQVEILLEEHFAPGVYYRSVVMPAGAFVIGHCHKTRHLNVIISGRANVLIDGDLVELCGYTVFESGAGVRKVMYIKEDTTWATIHPTNERDPDVLESQLITKSESYLSHAMNDLRRLQKIQEELQ